jgi:hypothetical protein
VLCCAALCARRLAALSLACMQVPSPAPAADPALQQLCEMGFDGAQAQRALAANNGDMQAAVAALTAGAGAGR